MCNRQSFFCTLTAAITPGRRQPHAQPPAAQQAGLPISHACHSGPARGYASHHSRLSILSPRCRAVLICSTRVRRTFNAHARIKVTPGLRHHAMAALHHGCDSHAHRTPHCLAWLRPTTNTHECPCLSLPALALCACAARPTQPRHNPHSSLLTLTSWPNAACSHGMATDAPGSCLTALHVRVHIRARNPPTIAYRLRSRLH